MMRPPEAIAHCVIEALQFFPLNTREPGIVAQLCRILPAIELAVDGRVCRTRPQSNKWRENAEWDDVFVFEVHRRSEYLTATCLNTSGEGLKTIGAADLKLAPDESGTSMQQMHLVRRTRNGKLVLAGTLHLQLTFFKVEGRRPPKAKPSPLALKPPPAAKPSPSALKPSPSANPSPLAIKPSSSAKPSPSALKRPPSNRPSSWGLKPPSEESPLGLKSAAKQQPECRESFLRLPSPNMRPTNRRTSFPVTRCELAAVQEHAPPDKVVLGHWLRSKTTGVRDAARLAGRGGPTAATAATTAALAVVIVLIVLHFQWWGRQSVDSERVAGGAEPSFCEGTLAACVEAVLALSSF